MDNSLTREELLKQIVESAIPLDVNDYHFNDDMVSVVRCQRCVHSAYPEARIVWCKRRSAYMPLKGFCSDGKEKE